MNIDEMQKLRQKVADALARVQTAKPAMGCSFEMQMQMQGIQAGSAAMLEAVLDWIDEIVAAGNQARTNSAAT